MAGLASEAANPRLLQERIEKTQAQIAKLQDELERFGDVAATIAELPKKLTHNVMVPMGKRAMMVGKIVRSNEILAHLGDEYYAWQSASSAVEAIERKKKNIASQIKEIEKAVGELSEKKSQVDSLFDIKKLYEEENIREIQESEEESESPVPRAAEEDIEEFFEVEEEERRKEEQTSWNWDEMMRRMEELEAREASGDNDDEEEEEKAQAPDLAAELKAKGNSAFAKRKFQESVVFYSQAIALEPSSHILYGNRSAAYHRLKKLKEALEDAEFAVALDDSWVKGHYRRAVALASMDRYRDAAEAFERAFELCPTDLKLEEKAQEMREKLAVAAVGQSHRPISAIPQAPSPSPVSSSFTSVPQRLSAGSPATSENVPSVIPAPAFSSSSASFSGSIMEREITERAPVEPSVVKEKPIASASMGVGGPRESLSLGSSFSSAGSTVTSSGAAPPRSRFAGNNPNGDVVTLQPVGEPQPVKRVSRFKAARGGQ
ncbi:hypothetical protein Gpo141_00000620 [Globisporangium polare]